MAGVIVTQYSWPTVRDQKLKFVGRVPTFVFMKSRKSPMVLKEELHAKQNTEKKASIELATTHPTDQTGFLWRTDPIQVSFSWTE